MNEFIENLLAIGFIIFILWGLVSTLIVPVIYLILRILERTHGKEKKKPRYVSDEAIFFGLTFLVLGFLLIFPAFLTFVSLLLSLFQDLTNLQDVLLAFLVVLFCLGLFKATHFIFSFSIRKRQDELYLKEYGVPISTQFQRVDKRHHSDDHNSYTNFYVITQWNDPHTKDIMVFESPPLHSDPSTYIKDHEITIIIHPKKPKKYFMNPDFLPIVMRWPKPSYYREGNFSNGNFHLGMLQHRIIAMLKMQDVIYKETWKQ